MVLQYVTECLWQYVLLLVGASDDKKKVEVVRLFFMFVVSFGDDSQHLPDAFDLLNERDLGFEFRDTADSHRFQKEDLVHSQKLRLLAMAVLQSCDVGRVESLSHQVATKYVSVDVAVLPVHDHRGVGFRFAGRLNLLGVRCSEFLDKSQIVLIVLGLVVVRKFAVHVAH